MPPRDYSHQDLRNRSFKNQDLTGADFSYADLRGCDFTGATLTGANFRRCRTGKSRKQLFRSIGIVISSGLLVLGITAMTNPIGGLFAAIVTSSLFLVFLNKIMVGVFSSSSISFAVLGISCICVGFNAAYVLLFGIAVALLEDENEKVIANFALFTLITAFVVICFRFLWRNLLSVGGTCFNQADLNRANFSHVVLKNTDFSESELSLVNWFDTKFVHTNLKSLGISLAVLQLCRLRSGRDRNFEQWILRDLNLRKIDLSGSTLVEADLSGSDLTGAILENADLSNTKAFGTDFSRSNLTGACIQNWGISAETKFIHIHCNYIYLESNQKERKPASGFFQAGDFERLVHHFTKTLDFLFRNGIDRIAFDFALEKLQNDYEDAQLSLHSVVDVGNGDQLVRFDVGNKLADKGAMHAHMMQNYEHIRTKLKPAQSKNRSLERSLSHVEGKVAIYEKHGTLWAVVLGKSATAIHDSHAGATLTITIGQLEDSKDPKALELAELLKQVRTEIAKPDSGLSVADQQKALKHLDTIGKLAQDKQNPDLLEKAGDALDALPTIMKRSDNLATFVEKYFPTFTAGVKAIFAFWGVTL